MIWDRIQFGFTITYHYLFPQLTMGLAFLMVFMKWRYLKTKRESWNRAVHFWARIFAINFAVGVVTGIPLEFQFGTNWAGFSNYAGGVIGQTLAMEGVFAFFLESSLLGLFLFGEKKLGQKWHFWVSVGLFVGSWLSGYFIIATNAFMQHPVGYAVGQSGSLQLEDFWKFIFNPWAVWEYLHNMSASVITASTVIASVGALWALIGKYHEDSIIFLRIGVITALIASVLQIFPTGDQHGKLVADYQPTALAALEGVFNSETGAPLAIIGQPNVDERRLENPIVVPNMLSFLAYGSFNAPVKGLNSFPEEEWPDNIEILYYSYHIMVGLGTLILALMGISAFLLYFRRLEKSTLILWLLMLAFPFPYIATTAGWLTAELGRQPWIVYRLLRTGLAASPSVNSGDVVFTTIGFVGLYFVIGAVFLYLVGREIARGPQTLNRET